MDIPERALRSHGAKTNNVEVGLEENKARGKLPMFLSLDGEFEGLVPFSEIPLFLAKCKDLNLHVRISECSLPAHPP